METSIRHSEFGWGWYPVKGPNPISALPPLLYYHRLALKLFRGERAISEFDWPFTPTHTSSPDFSTSVGSGLHNLLGSLHPGHG